MTLYCDTAGLYSRPRRFDLYNTTFEIGKRKRARKARAKAKAARKARRANR